MNRFFLTLITLIVAIGCEAYKPDQPLDQPEPIGGSPRQICRQQGMPDEIVNLFYGAFVDLYDAGVSQAEAYDQTFLGCVDVCSDDTNPQCFNECLNCVSGILLEVYD